MKLIYLSSSENKTRNLAKKLIGLNKNQLSKKCLIFALEGDLGTGKTIFAKGVAEALGIKKVIRSPSFIIQREFPYTLNDASGKFFHIDLWRMESEREVEKLKIEELIIPGNVILIEWAEKMGKLTKNIFDFKKVLIIRLKITFFTENQRKIEIL